MDIFVLLLGWYGCKIQHLDKYREIYKSLIPSLLPSAKLRFRSVTPAPVTHGIVLPPTEINAILEEIHEFYKDKSNTMVKKVIVHAFSNSGGLQLASMQNEMKSQPNKHNFKIDAIICDSLPGYTFGQWSAFRNFYKNVIVPAKYRELLDKSYVGKLLFEMSYGCFNLGMCGIMLQPAHSNARQVMWNYWKLLTAANTKTPSLFLYSTGDRVVDHNTVEAFAEIAQQASGNLGFVESFNFKDSQHVLHYYQYKTLYTQLVHDFLFHFIIISNIIFFFSLHPNFLQIHNNNKIRQALQSSKARVVKI
ncbi:hypothetical protein RFI_18294 [Reticulomyxa filosa]|uniref:Uncharacterized protein n=1 Tax=Reticulomyxa filosa TaxID=46433 RepID=X6MYS8_RETFI|nr:hypothetical protein RFI_18294 [Reticulomyxa filosa]|eukprot:ETO18951.1 hypothetical protein RFI_18294 [Reticulomyxa filosa]